MIFDPRSNSINESINRGYTRVRGKPTAAVMTTSCAVVKERPGKGDGRVGQADSNEVK